MSWKPAMNNTPTRGDANHNTRAVRAAGRHADHFTKDPRMKPMRSNTDGKEAVLAEVNLDLIRTDGGTQMRAELDQEVYLDYRDKWLDGVDFEPLDVFHDGAVYWLADGFHRFYRAREAKLATLHCRVHQGTQRDAILFAAGANASHGLRRTNADKRLAVEKLLGD